MHVLIEDMYKDATLILQLLQDNLALWSDGDEAIKLIFVNITANFIMIALYTQFI